uniref:Uncharacterized protein n=1 Tax=Nelumbo nucifera TaxID=4432 RepID=A0A822ZIU8_NELNU|nr:TPA_asm: hypothetical protein HUJ06_003027 [Nelumbo nucifera]
MNTITNLHYPTKKKKKITSLHTCNLWHPPPIWLSHFLGRRENSFPRIACSLNQNNPMTIKKKQKQKKKKKLQITQMSIFTMKDYEKQYTTSFD